MGTRLPTPASALTGLSNLFGFNLPTSRRGRRRLARQRRLLRSFLPPVIAHQTLSGLGQLASSRRIGGLISGASGVAGGAAAAVGGLIAGPPGALVGLALGSLGKALGTAVEKLRTWTENLSKANFQFSEFSPAMARVQAEAERREIVLGRERGQRLAPSARFLSQGIGEFNQGAAYFEDLAGRIQNILGGVGVRFGTLLQKAFVFANATNIVILERILQAIEKAIGNQTNLSVEDYFKQFGIPVPQEFQRPARFRQPPQP